MKMSTTHSRPEFNLNINHAKKRGWAKLLFATAPFKVCKRDHLTVSPFKDRHLHSNSLLKFLIAVDVSLEILPKRRKFLICIFKDTLESTFRNAVQAYELVIFTEFRVI